MKALQFLIILFLLFEGSTNIYSQIEPCEYIPLELSQIEPIWKHTVRDTSIIGYIHQGAVHNSEFAFLDGYNHLVFDKNLTFIQNDFAYLIIELVSNQDEYGAMIQKVDINTGELAWQYSIDPRTDTTYHKIKSVFLKDGRLILEGLRPVEAPMFGLFSFSTGFYSSYYFRKALDDKTGELLEYATVVNGDTLAHITGNFPYHDYYNYTGGEVEHLELQVYRERGSFLIRNILDSNGNITSNSDTVVRSFYSEIYDQNEENYESWRGKISKVNENSYYFVHEFIPNDTTSLPTAAELVHYDSDFNIVSSVDLTQFVFSDFKAIGIYSIDEEKIVLRGCLQTPPICKEFYYVLDHEYNLLDHFVSERDGDNIYGRVFVSNEGKNYVIERKYNEIGNSNLTMNVSNQNNRLDTIKTMHVEEENWAASPDFFMQMDDGDWIIKWSHGCWGDGVFDSFFHEIWRVSEEDFQLMVGILDRDNRPTNTVISPNPANNFIRLDLDIAKAQKIMIYNNLGNTVQMQIRVEANNINISQLPVGLYHINVHMMDGKYYSGSFVKQ